MTIQPRSEGAGEEFTFRRLTDPQPNGRVRVTIEVRRGDGRLAGKISQVRGGWQFRPGGGGGGARAGQVYPTAAECKQAIQQQATQQEASTQ